MQELTSPQSLFYCGLFFHIPLQRMSRNSQHFTDFGNRRARVCIQPSGQLNLLRRECFWPSATLPSRSRCLKPCVSSLLDDVPLEFRQCAEDVENEFPA